mgnify:CR=1 FL=1
MSYTYLVILQIVIIIIDLILLHVSALYKCATTVFQIKLRRYSDSNN